MPQGVLVLPVTAHKICVKWRLPCRLAPSVVISHVECAVPSITTDFREILHGQCWMPS